MSVQDIYNDSNLPALGVAVIKDGEVAWAEGFGFADLDSETEATADTSFMLASISKAVMATVFMTAWEADLLSLDDPVNDHLPFLFDNPHLSDEIVTVRHVVTHTTGAKDRWSVWGDLGDEDALYVYGDSPISLATMMEGYFAEGGEWYSDKNYTDHAPGSRYAYCNLTASLGAYLVEVSAQQSFEDYSRQNLFDPLELDHTAWRLSDLDENTVAMPYNAKKKKGNYEAYGHYGYPDYPDGALRSSPADLAKILATVGNGGIYQDTRVLSQEAVDEMLTVQLPDTESTQAVFWYWFDLDGRTVYGHDGSDYGVATQMAYDPDTGIGVVTLTNTDWGKGVSGALADVQTLLFEYAEAL